MPQNVPGEMIKDISIGIAITSFLFAITVLSPIFGFLCILFIPLPTLFYRVKLGRVIGAFIPAITIIVFALWLTRLAIPLVVLFELLLVGFVIGELFELDLSIEKTVVITCCAVVFSVFAFLVFYSNLTNTGIKELVSDSIRKNFDLIISLQKNMSVPEENIRMVSDFLEDFQRFLVRDFPALIISSTIFLIWTTILFARRLLNAKGLSSPDFGKLNLWKAPENFVWAVIGCGLMLLIPNNPLKVLGENGLLILMTIYFFQGIAIVSYFFEKRRLSRLHKFIIYSFIVWEPIRLIVIGLGFFDIWLNFRKLKMNKSS